MTTWTKKSPLYASLIAGLALAALPGTAAARMLSGFTARAYVASDAACFVNAQFGRITNANCSGPRRLCTPIWVEDRSGDPFNSSQTFHVAASATGSFYTNVRCEATAATKTGALAGQTGMRYLPAGGTRDIVMGAVTVPEYGSLYACCDLEQGATLNSIHWY